MIVHHYFAIGAWGNTDIEIKTQGDGATIEESSKVGAGGWNAK